VSDEGDKQAVIDRLRAEIAFLRERIHSSERSPRPTDTPQSRNERLQEREADLQNQLLDLQESYFNLGQRHAKLLAEVAKAQEGQNRDGAAENENGTAHALERLKRSNSFAEAVEQVLLEYEKTIQSLETSLAQTRSSLSATESELLEKETKCAYTETVNRQLEARVQKMMEREASTEHYLTDLEAKLSGHTSGEEKNAALVLELRKEIARVRESEANCEDYISTLEERLAEADQDAELMQREIERLEHVVERQRSLGRLELLMQELDQTQQRPKTPDLPTADVVEQLLPDDGAAVAEEQVGAASVHGGDHVRDRLPSSPPRSDKTSEGEGDILPPSTPAPNAAYSVPSPAQTDFVVEKLETVTQELLDLRVEHETTINEFELLAAKYEEALRTISQLQEGVDETRHPTNKDVFTTPASTRPSSFLGGARVSELKEDTQFSSSRSLSLELFSAGESPNISEPSDADAHPPRTHVIGMPHAQLDTQPFLNEIAHLKRLQLEKDEAMSSLEGQYEQLREQHHAVLDEVEELKTEVSKAKMNGAIGAASPIIRRKSSQGVMMVDRAHRSFASLRNIATENLEDRPDVMQSFEINLNAAMHELYARSERVQELEAEITSIKKEMEAKMTIISGLTRERSSLKKTSPMDMSMMSSMRDQLLENENKIRVLQETQEVREKTLLAEIDELRALLDGVKAPLPAPAAEPAAAEVTNSHQQDHKILELQGELEKWKSRHQATVESMQASESKLLATIKEMEEALEAVQSRPPATLAAESDDEKYRALQKAAEATLEHERTRHQEIVMSLQQKVEEYASSIDAYARRVEDLEHTGNESRRDLEERLRMAESTEKELESHRALVSLLERRIADHEATIRAHEEELISAKEAHAHELEELQNSTTGLIEARLSEQTSAHQALISSLQGEVTEARDEMGRLLQGLAETLGAEVAAEKVQAQVQALVRQRADVNARLRALQEQTEKLQGEKRTMKATITELTTLNEASVKEIERLNEEYQKSSRLVEELEEQLTTNFDQHQIASNRLSLLESEHLHRFEELVTSKNQALADLEAAKEEITRLEVRSIDPVHKFFPPPPHTDEILPATGEAVQIANQRHF
jgi:kinesin family protein 4/21/27